VHGFSEVIEASESETEVGESSTDMAARTLFLQQLSGVDEVGGIVVVLVDAGGDG
jgi:hypothetical protein